MYPRSSPSSSFIFRTGLQGATQGRLHLIRSSPTVHRHWSSLLVESSSDAVHKPCSSFLQFIYCRQSFYRQVCPRLSLLSGLQSHLNLSLFPKSSISYHFGVVVNSTTETIFSSLIITFCHISRCLWHHSSLLGLLYLHFRPERQYSCHFWCQPCPNSTSLAFFLSSSLLLSVLYNFANNVTFLVIDHLSCR